MTGVSAEVMWPNTGDSMLPTAAKRRRIEEEDRPVEVMGKRVKREMPMTGTEGMVPHAMPTGWSPMPHPLQRLT